jgi:pyridinium-3,5-bisthiocarboxylic acid mononucleotide nickel chelatase
LTLIAYLDCFAGVSGDMMLGALIDSGWPLERLQTVIQQLKLDGTQATAEHVTKNSIHGVHVTINIPAEQPHRHYEDLAAIINAADLDGSIQTQALATLKLLGEAESTVHNIPFDQVHFHEIGAVDTLVDIVGTLVGLHDLGVETVHSAPLPWSTGTIRTAHGILPVPPPAAAALMQGLPVKGVAVEGEMVTPTGAVLVRTLAREFGPIPAMTLQRVGYGAGSRDWPDRPNLLRIAIGQQAESDLKVETLAVLACNIDDMNPQWYGPLMQQLLDAKALDVWLTPIHMKKNRPAILIEVLCQSPHADSLRLLLLRHTTTLGVREYPVTRYSIPRRIETVQTAYGPINVKIATLPDGTTKIAPEHDDCATAAAKASVSIRDVWLAALQAAGSIEIQP